MKATAKLVLIALADRADDVGLCWPSLKDTAMRTGLTERAVQKALRWLQASRCLERKFRNGHSTHYLLTPTTFTPAPRSPRTAFTPNQEHPPLQQMHPTPEPDSPPGANQVHPEPSVEPPDGPSPTRQVARRPDKQATATAKTSETWNAYSEAYEKRYGVKPTRNARVNAQLSRFIDCVGAEEAPQVVAFYVSSNNGFYVTKGHSTGPLLQDAEKLRTEWVTGMQVTQTQARLNDQTASNPFAKMLLERRHAAQ
jgi:hypothetical protein